MKLTSEERKTLIDLKIEKSKVTFEEAQGVAGLGYWNISANRLYYASYYAVSALLLAKSLEAHTHGGTIRMFGKFFISENIISKEFGKLYSRLFEIRQIGDYDDFTVIEQDDVEPLILPTQAFIEEIEKLILFLI